MRDDEPEDLPTIETQTSIASLVSVQKSYKMDEVTLPVLRGIDLQIRPSLFTVVLGPSGSGKTTLLNLLGCLDRPDKGAVVVAGTDVSSLADDELSDFRRENVGFVFQSFNLIPVLTAFENIEYPLILAGMDKPRRERRVKRLLEAVGLENKTNHRPGQLSGGQRQRVAIARALAHKPKIVIADEPTANLDSQTGAAIIGLMRWMQINFRISFIFSSHDSGLIGAADDLIVLRDGAIQSVRRRPDAPDTMLHGSTEDTLAGLVPTGTAGASADRSEAGLSFLEQQTLPLHRR